MQIVINLSEESYKATCNGSMLPPDVKNVIEAINNGTPLPEGHGRLIDADKAKETMMYEMCGTGYQGTAMRVLDSEFYTPTIIEADKEE